MVSPLLVIYCQKDIRSGRHKTEPRTPIAERPMKTRVFKADWKIYPRLCGAICVALWQIAKFPVRDGVLWVAAQFQKHSYIRCTHVKQSQSSKKGIKRKQKKHPGNACRIFALNFHDDCLVEESASPACSSIFGQSSSRISHHGCCFGSPRSKGFET